jgi:hypothetical protein
LRGRRTDRNERPPVTFHGSAKILNGPQGGSVIWLTPAEEREAGSAFTTGSVIYAPKFSAPNARNRSADPVRSYELPADGSVWLYVQRDLWSLAMALIWMWRSRITQLSTRQI